MIHDRALIDRLSELPAETFAGNVFRATRRSLDPTTPSTAGGRWSAADGPAALYTSLTREGALAEIAYHWALFDPRPARPAIVHELAVRSDRTLRLIRSTLDSLGVSSEHYREPNYRRTQEIGAAVAFLGCDGLIVPSARWDCDNLVLFSDNLATDAPLEIRGAEEVEWQVWAEHAGLLH
ncbi:MAG: RES family NAD+ phosphorylase [Hyphomicrobiales bacterium]